MTIIKIISRMLKNNKKRSVCLERKSGEVNIIVQLRDENKPLAAWDRKVVIIKEDEVNEVIAGLLNIMDIKDLTISDFKNFEEFQEVFRLTDQYVMLRRMLGEVPETENPDEFDEIIENRRKVWREIHQTIENIGSKLEQEWAGKVWEKVKHKKIAPEEEGQTETKVKRKWV